MILTGEADAATVDCVALTAYKLAFPEHADCFLRVKSLGPMPIYPVLFNSRLPSKPLYCCWVIRFELNRFH